MAAVIAAARENLLDSICETIDDLLMRRSKGKRFPWKDLQAALRTGRH
jgi:hypothetical protein